MRVCSDSAHCCVVERLSNIHLPSSKSHSALALTSLPDHITPGRSETLVLSVMPLNATLSELVKALFVRTHCRMLYGRVKATQNSTVARGVHTGGLLAAGCSVTVLTDQYLIKFNLHCCPLDSETNLEGPNR